MADPLSVGASVVGIATAALKSVQFLVRTINDIKDAPRAIKDIRADLIVIESVLDDANAKSMHIPENSQIGPAVANCDRACKSFQVQITHWMKHSKEDKMFWLTRWKVGFIGPDRIKTFRGQLNDCKSTLSIAFSTTTLYVQPKKDPTCRC